jgi:hypothetical protein
MQGFNAAVPAAGTVIQELTLNTKKKDYIAIQSALTYGAAGTSIKVFLQTTIDDGVTWRDVSCNAFLLVSANKLSVLNMFIAPATQSAPASDGALADDTVVNGTMGDKWRLKIVIVGTYTTSTLRVDVSVQSIY